MSLKDFSNKQLADELERRKQDEKRQSHITQLVPIGTWQVKTEGDCEGKSDRNLGLHFGHIVDIAKKLASHAEYTLWFQKASSDKGSVNILQPTGVRIALDIDSQTWDMNSKERTRQFREMLNKQQANSKYEVDDSTYHAAVMLSIK